MLTCLCAHAIWAGTVSLKLTYASHYSSDFVMYYWHNGYSEEINNLERWLESTYLIHILVTQSIVETHFITSHAILGKGKVNSRLGQQTWERGCPGLVSGSLCIGKDRSTIHLTCLSAVPPTVLSPAYCWWKFKDLLLPFLSLSHSPSL